MKTFFICRLILLSTINFSLVSQAQADSIDDQNKDLIKGMNAEERVCAAAMCLMGGSGVAECSEYVNPYYAIEIFTDFLFDPLKTLKARGNWLSICSFIDRNTIDQVNTFRRGSLEFSGYYLHDGTKLTFRDLVLLELEYGIEFVDKFTTTEK